MFPSFLEEDVSIFDTATYLDPRSKGYAGALYDGRYVYFVPCNNGTPSGLVLQYDTCQDFLSPYSWLLYDTTQVHPDSKGFINGSFDGRFLYFVPYYNGKHHGQVTCYDTQGEFMDPWSWSVFDTTQLHPDSRGFIGSVFDGRYVYLVPYQLDFQTAHGQVTRYDTQGNFNDSYSWEVYDTTHIHPRSQGFHVGVYDGRYVYFVPYIAAFNPMVHHGQVTRYDTQGEFTEDYSWEVYDTTKVHENSKGFVGAVFDGRYIYFVPYHNGISRHGQFTRYDTQGEFTDERSWEVYDTTQIHPNSRGFFGGIFDGRYIYFVPHCRDQNVYHGQLSRYDTQGEFTNPASWNIYDTTRLHENNKGFIGGAFDGQFIYLAPYETEANKHTGQVLRLKTDASEIWE